MSDLTVVSHKGKLVTDSREVAEMVGKRHAELLRTIKGYEGILAERNFASGDFFIESAYKDGNNQTRLCYLLTKKGCEMVANKMTGEKGILFTAAYVSKFNEMEQQLDTSQLSPELQMFNGLFQSLAKQEMETKKLAGEVQGIRDVVALNTTDWRKDARQLISKMAQSRGGFEAYREVNSEIYKEVERRGKFDLSRRLTNKRRRLADEGVSKSKRDKLSKVDVIADDKRLVEIYVSVVKDFAIKHGVDLQKAN
ncbi:Rha family transcriptional regulator [Virgibacillus pantothenticus]|uniref:Rha family transcriptional regulator n=1 Tax=Virgibacillus pantothenticus TaxID=1473 RepID=UPI001C22CF25|nr:Rha family transcriptional regulator [Virgibacillus pantothenticus]MBU8568844.1 Rha family transcriptional regulator [Virgibacillus pantothenticus]MBU8601918.1 Rha family transcriptional regulator [Virgibacillus pantothenticus]MBU8635989.1 Rha family transcriptional regulator [Virgibacillus pantothenticus]MBU8644778.1 Rha family transcriptional regulator [Virgibacillus pantothenticus]MBU8647982.1 Rha family transcriptional regulator [Virgibacillus pantothenticus]